MAYCDKASVRPDNHKRHVQTHTHYQEIFLCTPEDEFKGVHAMNPIAVNPEKLKIQPFAAMPFNDIQLGLWRFQEEKRRRGDEGAVPPTTPIDHYFIAHPEQAAIAINPEFKFYMPAPDSKEFQPIDQNCLQGKFKLNIRPEANGQ